MIDRIEGWLTPNQRVTLLADRGFGDQNVYDYLDCVGWDYVIRFRGKIKVTSQAGTTRTARGWVGSNGRPKMLPEATVTEKRFKVPALVVVWDKKMKEPWWLATSLSDCSARTVVKNYGRRFSIEETFRDHKDPHLGWGSARHTSVPRIVAIGCFCLERSRTPC